MANYVCDCPCHSNPGMMHFDACCEGPCEWCGQDVTSQKSHLAACQERPLSEQEERDRRKGRHKVRKNEQ